MEVGGKRHIPAALPPGKITSYPLYSKEGGLTSGPVWMNDIRTVCVKSSKPTDRHDIRYARNSRRSPVLKPNVHNRVHKPRIYWGFLSAWCLSLCFCKDRKLLDEFSKINPLNPELNPICYLLALLAHHFLHVSRIMVKSLTLRLLMSYIYGAHILDVSRSHTTTHHSR